MSAPISRFQFLRGDLSGKRQEIRPPWALPEADFTEQCSRCGDCIVACPERILRIGRGGFPRVDHAMGECSFCGDCLRVCARGALRTEGRPDGLPWDVKARVTEGCLALRGIECRVCRDQCAGNAIRFRPRKGGPALPCLETGSCNGCGACVAACPAGAIEMRTWNGEGAA